MQSKWQLIFKSRRGGGGESHATREVRNSACYNLIIFHETRNHCTTKSILKSYSIRMIHDEWTPFQHDIMWLQLQGKCKYIWYIVWWPTGIGPAAWRLEVELTALYSKMYCVRKLSHGPRNWVKYRKFGRAKCLKNFDGETSLETATLKSEKGKEK